VFFILHAPESARLVSEFTRIVINGFNMDNLILSRVMGGSSKGIEQASKECFRLEKNFLVVHDLDDLKQIIDFDKLLLFVPPKYAENELVLQEIVNEIKSNKKIGFVFGGGKVSGITRKEIEAGTPVKILDTDIGPLGLVAILLHELKKLL